jgi:hypothetical protein
MATGTANHIWGTQQAVKVARSEAKKLFARNWKSVCLDANALLAAHIANPSTPPAHCIPNADRAFRLAREALLDPGLGDAWLINKLNGLSGDLDSAAHPTAGAVLIYIGLCWTLVGRRYREGLGSSIPLRQIAYQADAVFDAPAEDSLLPSEMLHLISQYASRFPDRNAVRRSDVCLDFNNSQIRAFQQAVYPVGMA